MDGLRLRMIAHPTCLDEFLNLKRWLVVWDTQHYLSKTSHWFPIHTQLHPFQGKKCCGSKMEKWRKQVVSTYFFPPLITHLFPQVFVLNMVISVRTLISCMGGFCYVFNPQVYSECWEKELVSDYLYDQIMQFFGFKYSTHIIHKNWNKT